MPDRERETERRTENKKNRSACKVTRDGFKSSTRFSSDSTINEKKEKWKGEHEKKREGENVPLSSPPLV